MKNKSFSIGQISDLLGIPSSTIRFWEKKGLLAPIRDKVNDYRSYTPMQLLQLSDILSYRNLDFPIEKIYQLERSDLKGYEQFLTEQELLQQQKMGLLLKQQQLLENRWKRLTALQNLLNTPFQICTESLPPIYAFTLENADLIKRYVEEPFRYIWLQDSQIKDSGRRGIALEEPLNAQLLYTPKEKQKYICCLLIDHVYEGKGDNLEELLTFVHKRYNTGKVINRYLLCASEEGILVDYYKCYIEVLCENI